MIDLKEKAILLMEHLSAEEIIELGELDALRNQTFDNIILLLRQKLQAAYPDTKLKHMIKSVHFANGFSDEALKHIAFILTDEIDQYLSINGFLDREASVDYFNDRITAAGFVIHPDSLVDVLLDSLLLSKKISAL